MDLAAPFYTSSAFWAGASAMAAVFGAAVVVWATLAVGFPRRRLHYGLRDAAPLLRSGSGMPSNLQLQHRQAPADTADDGESGVSAAWQILDKPRVLTLQLISRGRKDIPSDAYNDHQPLRLDVGIRIVEILQVTSRPKTLGAPEITIDGTSLRIGPGLIGRRHEITIHVLTDGGMPRLTCRSPLIDVQVRHRTDPDLVADWSISWAVCAAVAVAVVAVAWVNPPPIVVEWAAGVGAVAGAVATAADIIAFRKIVR